MLAVSNAADPIDCREAELLIQLRLDEEVGPEDSLGLDVHLHGCDACRQQMALLEKTRAHLRSKENHEVVPSHLAEAIQRNLAQVQPANAAPKGGPLKAAKPAPSHRRPLWAAAIAGGVFVVMAVVAAAGLGLNFGQRATNAAAATDRAESAEAAGAENDTVALSVANHSLDVPVDVASPDPKVVEAFLRPRLGQPIDVPQLAAKGFGLRGGRVVAVQKTRAAQLVYDTGLGKRMTVVVVPDREGRLLKKLGRKDKRAARGKSVTEVHRAQARGYDVRLLSRGHMLYAVVDSDGNGANALTEALNERATTSDVEAVDIVTGVLP